MIITIDGPAGTGKTSIAKLLSSQLHFVHIDTGAMYRAITYLLLQRNIALQDEEKIQVLLDTFDLSLQKTATDLRYFIYGEEITQQIRSSSVSDFVSRVAQLGPVRRTMVSIQRKLGTGHQRCSRGTRFG